MAKTKLVYINDDRVWQYIQQKQNFSAWVRDCALAEMGETVPPTLRDVIEQLVRRYAVRIPAEPIVIPQAEEMSVEGWL